MIIEITGVTNGVGPYDIYLCNWDLTGCFYISGVTSIPPNVFINSDNYFPKEGLLKVRVVDNYGCVDLIDSPCEPTPTPTPTATPRPTPTPTPTPTIEPILCSLSGYSFELNKITPTATPTTTATPTPTPTEVYYCTTINVLTDSNISWLDYNNSPQSQYYVAGTYDLYCVKDGSISSDNGSGSFTTFLGSVCVDNTPCYS